MKIKHIQQGIGGIKEIKVSGNELLFLKYYDEHNKKYNQISKFLMLLLIYQKLF